MWVDIYGRQARWNGVAWELVKGQGDFDKPDGGDKPQKSVLPGHVRVSGLRARVRLDKMDHSDPLIEAYSSLSDNQLGVVRMYTQSYYSKFNSYLRGKPYTKPPAWEVPDAVTEENFKGLDDGEEDFIKQAVNEMVDAMGGIPDSPTGSYYRGMSGDPETSQTVQQYAQLEPGDILSDKGFGSYTADKEIPGDFMTYGGRNQNILLINKSERLKNVEPVTANPGESEHLSMPGAEFRVRKNEIVEDRRFGKMRVIEIEDV
jgi:hypothetical protein